MSGPAFETVPEFQALLARVKSLEDRVAALQADSHPPIDLRPAIVEILAELEPPT